MALAASDKNAALMASVSRAPVGLENTLISYQMQLGSFLKIIVLVVMFCFDSCGTADDNQEVLWMNLGFFFRVRGWRDHDLHPRDFPSLLAWLLGTLHSILSRATFQIAFRAANVYIHLKVRKCWLLIRKNLMRSRNMILAPVPTYSGFHFLACRLRIARAMAPHAFYIWRIIMKIRLHAAALVTENHLICF